MSRQDDQFLAHYGVLGMRWGRRRNNRPSGSDPASSKPAASRKPSPPKPSDARKMSMDELKKTNERLKAESEYRKYLSEMNPKKDSKFKQFLFDAASKAALGYLESAAKAYGTKVGGKKDPVDQPKAAKEAGKKVIEAVLKNKDAVSITPEKKQAAEKQGKKKIEDIFDWIDNAADW